MSDLAESFKGVAAPNEYPVSRGSAEGHHDGGGGGKSHGARTRYNDDSKSPYDRLSRREVENEKS